ncbi:MAG: hypothetical protein EZS28_037471 [Streblomastix strix]|uniref:Uncharacterized protein n=1 Tax=Streblomastix strix TaxID=222440 RepID=A0A5J4UA10_9EUKA|nr:MAG: hypothetical protein EZS28_037471 [Streblomastix strix]
MVSLSSYEFSELTPVPYRREVSWSLWASTGDEDISCLEQSISEKQERQQRIILHLKGRLQMTETNGRVHLLLSQFRSPKISVVSPTAGLVTGLPYDEVKIYVLPSDC